ncbi:MAG: prepilin-type N-terminal cleavage/methylation domain-containing protein [Acidimicrobiia bacterium]|nr:prepilin-type N-terminal cleavage/methylation domain-containing protein [Acidimicrobiia bacterium]
MDRTAERDRNPDRDGGFTIVEVVVAFTILAVVILGITSAVAVGFDLLRKAKVNQISTSLAGSELENVRRMRDISEETGEDTDYEDIGTVDGNPPGIIEPVRQTVVRGITFEITTEISWVEDTAPGVTATHADAKLVSVTVRPANGVDGKAVTARTIVAPPNSSNPATIIVSVVDRSGPGTQPAVGVNVLAAQASLGNRSDFTDASGQVVFGGLATDVQYDVSVNDVEWQELTCTPDSITPNPLDEVYVTCEVYKLLEARIDVTGDGGGALPGNDYHVSLGMEGNVQFPFGLATWQGMSPPTPPSANSLSGTTWTINEFAPGTDLVANMTYHVSAWAPDHRPSTSTATLPSTYPGTGPRPTGGVSVELEYLGPGSTRRLTIHAERWNNATFLWDPVGSAKVLVQDSSGTVDVIRWASTFANGDVTLDLQPGTYEITVGDASSSLQQTVNVTTDATTIFQLS